MQGDDVRLARGQHVAHAEPHVAAFARFQRRQPALRELLVDGLQTRSVVPQDGVVLRQAREVILGEAELLLVGAIQPDDDFAQIRHLREMIENVAERRTLELGEQRRQDQRDGTRAGEADQLPFQRFHRLVGEIVKRRDDTVLEEITHSSVLFLVARGSI
ncbi:hypothetical protein [Breoghania sp. L-A4]|uniref:hypothetical protein n=1 Tax=Breoghania sp. L-A4 TaxID=2304600 RepID=UPI0020BF2B94|nr:hypothetical protein [Breoghania sp. L-A4]